MHCSFVLAEIHWMAGFKSFFLKATAISPHFQISSVDTTHHFRLSGNAVQNWKTKATVHFLIDEEWRTQSSATCVPTNHAINNVYVCVSLHLSSSALHLMGYKQPQSSLDERYVHSANPSTAKEQELLWMPTIKCSHNVLAECRKITPGRQESSQLTVTEQPPE